MSAAPAHELAAASGPALTFAEVTKLLHVRQAWQGLDDCLFQLRVWPLPAALEFLRTCWSIRDGDAGTLVLDAFLRHGGTFDARTRELASDFDLDRPLLLVVISRDVLHARWPTLYPTGGSELVIIDGNHRLAALALRRSRGVHDDLLVGGMVCT